MAGSRNNTSSSNTGRARTPRNANRDVTARQDPKSSDRTLGARATESASGTGTRQSATKRRSTSNSGTRNSSTRGSSSSSTKRKPAR
jgi:hypothetical protein